MRCGRPGEQIDRERNPATPTGGRNLAHHSPRHRWAGFLPWIATRPWCSNNTTQAGASRTVPAPPPSTTPDAPPDAPLHEYRSALPGAFPLTDHTFPRFPGPIPTAGAPARTIEFWFEFGSNYSYLGVMRIGTGPPGAASRSSGSRFSLAPSSAASAGKLRPSSCRGQGDYVWRDMARLYRKYGLIWRQPSVFPRTAVLALRVALVGAEKPWMNEFCQRIMRLNFALDQDIGSEAAVKDVLRQLACPPTPSSPRPEQKPNKLRLRGEPRRPRPAVSSGADVLRRRQMFWGNDRLDDALDFAAGSRERAERGKSPGAAGFVPWPAAGRFFVPWSGFSTAKREAWSSGRSSGGTLQRPRHRHGGFLATLADIWLGYNPGRRLPASPLRRQPGRGLPAASGAGGLPGKRHRPRPDQFAALPRGRGHRRGRGVGGRHAGTFCRLR